MSPLMSVCDSKGHKVLDAGCRKSTFSKMWTGDTFTSAFHLYGRCMIILVFLSLPLYLQKGSESAPAEFLEEAGM